MNNNLLDILCDPIDKSPLVLDGEKLRGQDNSYDIVRGIPVLLEGGLAKKEQEALAQGIQKNGFSWAEKHWFNLGLNKLFDNPEKESMLLCFGSGSPKEKKYLNEIGYQVVTMDINPLYQGVDVICDGHFLPFIDNCMDAVVSFEVFEHLHSPWLAIQEIGRILKPGGILIGSVAFMKEFHQSYFHISHWGMLRLFELAGFKCQKIYGGQNIFGRVISKVAPIGPAKTSERIYNFVGKYIFALRRGLWSLRHGISSNNELPRFDKIPLSFADYDSIKYSPAIIFKATKTSE